MFKCKLNQLKMYQLRYGAEVVADLRPFNVLALVRTPPGGGARSRSTVSDSRSPKAGPRFSPCVVGCTSTGTRPPSSRS